MIRPDQWQPADGLTLAPNALKAATMGDRNAVVVAGPGAGKTELLAQRADFLLRTGHCPYPRRILAVSFKVDAARNLAERVRRRCGPALADRFDSFTFHAFAKRLIDNFRPALTGASALDADYQIDRHDRIYRKQITFEDLVPLGLEIVDANVYARRGLHQTYSHVFLDEFQDCTANQYQLMKAAFGPSNALLTAVGDTKQRIMLWAGALDGVLETFAEDFFADRLPLYQNFRSAPRLRRMQNRMIARMDPTAISLAEDLAGDDGVLDVLDFPSEYQEAQTIGDLISGWLAQGVPPGEIAVLIRNQPHLVGAVLADELRARGIAFRNEQDSQDLTAEPAAALVFGFLRVIADNGQPDAYAELMRIVTHSGSTDQEMARFDSRLKRMLATARAAVRDPTFNTDDAAAWRNLVGQFLSLVSLPVLTALSASYQEGDRLDDLIAQATDAFARELAVDGDAVAAMRRLSDADAVRILTIHKCKGLEFGKVVVLGVEKQLFWGNDLTTIMSEFFVAISRAKQHLVLTHVEHRDRPGAATGRWDEWRTPYRTLVGFAYEQ
jgi:superfamily I DNA/RNA helicase